MKGPVDAGPVVNADTQPTEKLECQESLPPATGLSQENPLRVIPRCQEGMYTCWATSAEMILEYLGGGRVRQCDQANEAFHWQTCCGGNDLLILDPKCDSPWVPEFERWGYENDFRSQVPLSYSDVMAEIDAKRPFAFSWTARAETAVTGAGTQAEPVRISHMMVIIGYGVDPKSGVQTVTFLDPAPFRQTDPVIVPYSEYDGTTGAYEHAEDYYGVRPKLFP